MKKLLCAFLVFSLSFPAVAAEQLQNGRYQIVLSSITNTSKYLLDTWTGKTWQLVQFTEFSGEPLVWMAMDRIDGMKDYQEWQKAHFTKEEAELVKKATPSQQK